MTRPSLRACESEDGWEECGGEQHETFVDFSSSSFFVSFGDCAFFFLLCRRCRFHFFFFFSRRANRRFVQFFSPQKQTRHVTRSAVSLCGPTGLVLLLNRRTYHIPCYRLLELFKKFRQWRGAGAAKRRRLVDSSPPSFRVLMLERSNCRGSLVEWR